MKVHFKHNLQWEKVARPKRSYPSVAMNRNDGINDLLFMILHHFGLGTLLRCLFGRGPSHTLVRVTDPEEYKENNDASNDVDVDRDEDQPVFIGRTSHSSRGC